MTIHRKGSLTDCWEIGSHNDPFLLIELKGNSYYRSSHSRGDLSIYDAFVYKEIVTIDNIVEITVKQLTPDYKHKEQID